MPIGTAMAQYSLTCQLFGTTVKMLVQWSTMKSQLGHIRATMVNHAAQLLERVGINGATVGSVMQLAGGCGEFLRQSTPRQHNFNFRVYKACAPYSQHSLWICCERAGLQR